MNRYRLAICLALIAALTAVCAGAMAEELILPGALRVIEAEAFAGAGAAKVVLPEGIEEIGSRAFAGSGVREINLPGTLTYIADDAFEGAELSTVTAEKNTYAYKWAVQQGYIQSSGTIKLKIKCDAKQPVVGDSLCWTVKATGGAGAYVYRYSVYRDGQMVFSTGDTDDKKVTYTCEAEGSYHVVCVVTDGEATDSAASAAILVETARALSAEVQCNLKSAVIGDEAQWTVTADGGSGDYSYYFELYRDGALLGKADAGNDNVLGHTFKTAGVYYALCRVSDGQGETTVTSDEILVSSGLSATISCSATKGTVDKQLKWTVKSTVTNCSYYYEIFRDGVKIAKADESKDNILAYTPSQAGTYYVTCRVTSGSETTTVTSKDIVVADSGTSLAISSLKVDASQFMTTETHTWTAAATGGKSPYRFSYTLNHNGVQVDYQGFDTAKTYSYTFFQQGDYVLTVQVRDANNKTASDEFAFTVSLGGTTMTGVVRVYVDCDSKGNIKKSSGNTGHFELQISNDSAATTSFDNHELVDPVFSYGKDASGNGQVKVFDSSGVSRTSGTSFKLYTFTFTTTAEQVDALLNSELKDMFVNSATEVFDGSTYNYSVINNAFRTYQLESSNCFTALAKWCSLLGYGELSAIQATSDKYTDYIAWKLFEKYGKDWEYERTVIL